MNRFVVEDDGMASASPFDKPAPAKVYRYRSMSGANVAYTADILRESQMFWSSYKDFNDPFDCAPAFEIQKGLKRRSAIQQMRARQRGKRSRDEVNRATRSLLGMSGSALIKRQREAFERTVSAAGIICYTEDPRSCLMWSHYADNHRGICLQFDMSAVTLDPASILYPVNYSPDRPVMDITGGTDPDQLVRSLTTKSREWDYEREWRAITSGAAGKTLPFHPSLLTGIIVGCRASDETRRAAQDWAQERRLSFFQARMSEDRFLMEIDGLP